MNRAAVAALMIPIAAVSIAACQHQPPSRDAATQMATSADTTRIPGPPDPYSNNGVWSVPDQIKPGTYAVQPNGDDVVSLRWWSMCRDDKCLSQIDETTGYAPEGGGAIYIKIPDDGSVKGFHNNGVRLTPAG